MFLQTELTDIPVVDADSLRHATATFIQQLQADPEGLWKNLIEQAINFGLKVVGALLIYFVGAWLIRYIKRILTNIFTRRKAEKTLATFVTSFVTIMLTIILIIITVSTLGVNTTSLAALLAAGGMAIGMALSGTVQNFAGGIMLLVFKPFKAGDFIEAQGLSGSVMEVNIASTKILTTDNHIVILPNGSLANDTINNFSAQPLRRVDIEVSVAYGSDADKCIESLKEIILSDERVLTSKDERPKVKSVVAVNTSHLPIPDPFVGLKSLNSNDITFVTRFWVRTENYWDVYFDMNKNYYTELPKHGFTFAYPHCDVTILNQNS